jgi:hypothetical protein
MATVAHWAELCTLESAFSDRVRQAFDAGRHKTMATLRRDGAPRISGIELEFTRDDVWVGMMDGSVKAGDLRRDPRLAVHSPSIDPPPDEPGEWPGEAKLAGVAVESQEQGPSSPRLWIDLTEVVLTRIGEPADHLVIESWHPGRGLERIERR